MAGIGLRNHVALWLSLFLCCCWPLDHGQAAGEEENHPSCEGEQLDRSGWTPQEHWVWKQLCNGRGADLMARATGNFKRGNEKP